MTVVDCRERRWKYGQEDQGPAEEDAPVEQLKHLVMLPGPLAGRAIRRPAGRLG